MNSYTHVLLLPVATMSDKLCNIIFSPEQRFSRDGLVFMFCVHFFLVCSGCTFPELCLRGCFSNEIFSLNNLPEIPQKRGNFGATKAISCFYGAGATLRCTFVSPAKTKIIAPQFSRYKFFWKQTNIIFPLVWRERKDKFFGGII